MAEETDNLELGSILATTTVGELTLKGVPLLAPEDTVAEAAAQMRNQSHGSALVCDKGRLVGIITERDLLRMVHSGKPLETSVSTVMTADPKTVTTDDTLLDAIRLMDTGGYRRVPVVDGSGAPAGIVDVKMATHFLVEYFPEAVYNQASHDELNATKREGA